MCALISRRLSPVPEVTRDTGLGALDIDQLASVLARLLEL
jgi:hypothetical protein